LNQFAAAFATGNRALLTQTQCALLPADLPQEVRVAIEVIAPHTLQHVPLKLALADASQLRSLAMILAERDGALVPIVESNDVEPIPLWRLVAERAVCVNTTAAGGNASLMTLRE